VVEVVVETEAAAAAGVEKEAGVAGDAVERKQVQGVAYGAEEPCTTDQQRRGVAVGDGVEYVRDVVHAAVVAGVEVAGDVEEEGVGVGHAFVPMGLVEEERMAAGRGKGTDLMDVVDA
jgi:hypothetical protein